MLTVIAVPYRTFPFANRRGTTVLDRSTAYPWFGWKAGRVAGRLASAGDVDIVHGLGASVLGYALQNGAARRAPLVFNPQGLEEFGATDPSRARLKRIGYWPLQVAVKRCAQAADCVIATDRALVDVVSAHLGVRDEVVRVVPNAIEPLECDLEGAVSRASALRAQVGIGPSDLLLLSVGRLERNKGFDILLRALSLLAAENRLPGRWRWVLVGDGPLRSALTRKVQASGIADRVVIWGRSESADLHGWYEAATLFVHPTLYEGSSLVTLEAMAHRRPVVATRAGGLPDKVLPGITGWLVPPGDERALAAAIHEAATSREQRLAMMGNEGRLLVEREFSWHAAVDRLLQIYDELLSGRADR
jgi:glycosyltransferase involved in cell wall biosynthesis